MKQADTKDVQNKSTTSAEDNDVRDMLTRLYIVEFIESGLFETKLKN